MSEPYQLRPATLADADTIVAHRVGMFSEMGVAMDIGTVSRAFRQWLDEAIPSGVYRAWVIESESGEIVAGGGITVVPWPPGPRHLEDRMAFVYNIYTDPAHRHHGLARRIMAAIHAWCREAGIVSLGLAASPFARPLYESMGYREAPNPYMFVSLER